MSPVEEEKFWTGGATAQAPVLVERVEEDQWQALEGGCVTGHGDVARRPDGRTFVSVDAWSAAAFERLVRAVPAALPKPLYAVVDEDDTEQLTRWQRAGFAVHRREWVYSVPTAAPDTDVPLPDGVSLIGVGGAEEEPLRALDRVVRAEVEAGPGWWTMPAEVLPLPPGVTVVDPAKYAVAVRDGAYVGMLRLAPVTRRPRIGLLAVRESARRQGIGRALLARVLADLYRSGVRAASAEVHGDNAAALALFDGIGAQRSDANLELVLR
ncbi:GNAT family N-acetyltransferase [Streptomyces sp. VRA16 Mangrove soil]|uniref:GNAT family N-acetyltransferase n=1 Tax=Streptomyces sp. VRA16 Mangrove soil TaxID=2817434 RepID=UPI001A9ECAFF|nr:GNAT family N-acetyltransferase [Streptomyces sp. VRA16 Mangrove soil]MBO1336558.1 GNAT family N-acetyltransferase [Streptomyces sp. VRA16 Mangrove soil]